MSGLSFKFSKKITPKLVEPIKTEEPNEELYKDFVLSVENNKIKSTNQSKKKEYVIPLIPILNNLSSIEKEAVQSIIADANQYEGLLDHKNDHNKPGYIIQQIKAPEGSLINPDYNAVPIEEYGLAMLRGMGWKPGVPIGRNTKKIVKPIEPVIRPKGLGLGAEKVINDEKHLKLKRLIEEDGDQKGEIMENENTEKQDVLELKACKVGAYVKVLKGSPYTDMCGQIDGIDEENGRLIIKLSEDLIVSIPYYLVTVITPKEFSKYQGTQNEVTDKNLDKILALALKHSPSNDRGKYGLIKMKTTQIKSEIISNRDQSVNESINNGNKEWPQTNLIVRIIDKSFKDGKYFRKKVILVKRVTSKVDNASGRKNYTYQGLLLPTDFKGSDNSGQLIIRLISQKATFLKDLTTNMLETVVPKYDSARVMILDGKYKNHIGTIIERNKNRQTAKIRFFKHGKEQDKPVEKEITYDLICEYIEP